MTSHELEAVGDLLTVQHEGRQTALGYLFAANGKVFEPTLGAVPVTREQADRHNAALEAADLDRLDAVDVGDAVVLYVTGPRGQEKVTTWPGRVVSASPVKERGHYRHWSFQWRGKRFVARRTLGERRDPDDECFVFTRET